ncbi:MAG: Lrp/AsnC family transcriptional regulator [Candidatus Nezhaarchaeota archaeon]|nr:Lrp/AsnC family transcriptional regulator [Candidatus Nezhaarchaeota archaeon]
MSSKKLDEIDLKIIENLKANGRLSYKELAQKLSIGIATVFKRVKRLERLGVIKGYTAIVDDSALGKAVTGYIGLEVRPSDTSKVLEELMKMDEVVEVATVTGAFDILVKVKVSSLEELRNFIYIKTTQMKEILKTTTMIALEILKS